MRLHHLDLNLLVALDALLSERHVTRAGQRLRLSQSATSCALGRLREHLGDPILVQSGRRMVPTDYAVALAPRVRDLLVQIEATLSQRPHFDAATSSRHFTVASSDYAVNVLMLDLQRRMAVLAPHASIEVLAITDTTVDATQRGEVDFAIVPDAYRVGACASEPLFEDRLVCLVARHNRRIARRISLEQFAAAGHVVYQPNPGHVIAFDAWLRARYAISPAVRASMPSYSLLPRAVAGTSRIATVPLKLAELYCRSLPLRVVEPSFEMPRMTETLIWHASRTSAPAVAWMRGLIREVGGGVSGRTAAGAPH